MKEQLEMMQAMALVLNHTDRVEKVDALFVHSLSDLEVDVINFAGFCKSSEHADNIVFNGTRSKMCEDRNIDYKGREHWQELTMNSVFPCFEVYWTPPALHTYAEADAVQQMCQENRWLSLGVLATPYHILRCTLTHLAAMKRRGRYFRIYPMTIPADFCQTATKKLLGGGSFTKLRVDILEEEFNRIQSYIQIGDCVPLRELIAYFRNRDK